MIKDYLKNLLFGFAEKNPNAKIFNLFKKNCRWCLIRNYAYFRSKRILSKN